MIDRNLAAGLFERDCDENIRQSAAFSGNQSFAQGRFLRRAIDGCHSGGGWRRVRGTGPKHSTTDHADHLSHSETHRLGRRTAGGSGETYDNLAE